MLVIARTKWPSENEANPTREHDVWNRLLFDSPTTKTMKQAQLQQTFSKHPVLLLISAPRTLHDGVGACHSALQLNKHARERSRQVLQRGWITNQSLLQEAIVVDVLPHYVLVACFGGIGVGWGILLVDDGVLIVVMVTVGNAGFFQNGHCQKDVSGIRNETKTGRGWCQRSETANKHSNTQLAGSRFSTNWNRMIFQRWGPESLDWRRTVLQDTVHAFWWACSVEHLCATISRLLVLIFPPAEKQTLGAR